MRRALRLRRELESVVAFVISKESAPPPSTLTEISGLAEALRGPSRVERKRGGTGAAASTVSDALAFIADLLLCDVLG